MDTAGNQKQNTLRRDLFVALQCGAFAALMGGLCCAAIPLCSWFRAGGLGGTTEVAGAPPHALRLSSVRFDRDLAAALAFRSPRNRVAAELGPAVTVSFRGAASRIGAAQAGCSVGAGLCLGTINCFCPAPQTMRHGERVVLCADSDFADESGQNLFTLLRSAARTRVRVPARPSGRT